MLFNKSAQKTLLNALNLKINSKLEAKDIPQSDYSENDSKKSTYIKNRTHWTERKNIKNLLLNEEYLYCQEGWLHENEINFDLIENRTYIVTFNDVKYTLIPKLLYDTLSLGNRLIIDNISNGLDDVPFMYRDGYFYTIVNGRKNYISISILEEDNSETVLLEKTPLEYAYYEFDSSYWHYDDAKFAVLFDDVVYENLIPTENNTLETDDFIIFLDGEYSRAFLICFIPGIHNISFKDNTHDHHPFSATVGDSWSYYFENMYLPITENKILSVIWNDKEYLCKIIKDDSRFSIGGSDAGEPFFIIWWDDGTAEIHLIETGVMSISSFDEEVHKLDPKFIDLPDDILTEDKMDEVIDRLEYDISSKMATNNPKGSGSFSMTRKANTTVGSYSTTEGYEGEASGAYSHAEGSQTVASGQGAHSEGIESVASGYGAHAEGNKTKAQGYQAHAEGISTVASGNSAHAEGASTTASGPQSHAEGHSTDAIGAYSHAEGYQTVATGSSQHVQGEWNVPDQNTSTPARTLHAHIVGNGTGIDARSNAHTLDWDGNAWFAGDVYVGSFSGVNKDSGSKKLIATPSNAVAGDLLTYDGTNWVRISRADLIAEIIAALPRAEEATF